MDFCYIAQDETEEDEVWRFYPTSLSSLSKDFEHAHYSGDDGFAPATIYAAINGKPVECEFKASHPAEFDSDDYADVSISIVRKDNGESIAGFGYRIDGRA